MKFDLNRFNEYPDYFLDYREHLIPHIRWIDRIYSQEPEWAGNVFDFCTRVSAKLVLDLKKTFKLVLKELIDCGKLKSTGSTRAKKYIKHRYSNSVYDSFHSRVDTSHIV